MSHRVDRRARGNAAGSPGVRIGLVAHLLALTLSACAAPHTAVATLPPPTPATTATIAVTATPAPGAVFILASGPATTAAATLTPEPSVTLIPTVALLDASSTPTPQPKIPAAPTAMRSPAPPIVATATASPKDGATLCGGEQRLTWQCRPLAEGEVYRVRFRPENEAEWMTLEAGAATSARFPRDAVTQGGKFYWEVRIAPASSSAVGAECVPERSFWFQNCGGGGGGDGGGGGGGSDVVDKTE